MDLAELSGIFLCKGLKLVSWASLFAKVICFSVRSVFAHVLFLQDKTEEFQKTLSLKKPEDSVAN